MIRENRESFSRRNLYGILAKRGVLWNPWNPLWIRHCKVKPETAHIARLLLPIVKISFKGHYIVMSVTDPCTYHTYHTFLTSERSFWEASGSIWVVFTLLLMPKDTNGREGDEKCQLVFPLHGYLLVTFTLVPLTVAIYIPSIVMVGHCSSKPLDSLTTYWFTNNTHWNPLTASHRPALQVHLPIAIQNSHHGCIA